MTDIVQFSEAKDPMTSQWARPRFIADHFAPGVHGLKFACGTIYNPAMVEIKMR